MVALLAEWTSWRFTFVISGVLLGAGLVTNWLWFPKDKGERVRDLVIFSRYWSLLSMQFFRVALTVNLSHRIAYWAIVIFFAAFLIETYDVSVGFVAMPLAIAAMGQVVGSYGGGFVANRKHRAAIIAAVIAAGGVCGVLFFAAPVNLWVAVILATVGTGLLSIPFPTLVAASTEYSGDSKATGVGMMGLSNQSGGMLGGAIAGALLANVGYEAVGYMCLGASVASAAIASLCGRQLRRDGG